MPRAMSETVILVLAANPLDTPRLEVDKEVRAIRESLRGAKFGHFFRVEPVIAARLRDVRRGLLDFSPKMVHFCGHGSSSGLMLESGSGMQTVSGEVLEDLFSHFAEDLECIVLDACYSQAQAESISREIDFVVGMDGAMADEDAPEFAAAFYDGIGSGLHYDQAFGLARNALTAMGLQGRTLAVLYGPTEAQQQRRARFREWDAEANTSETATSETETEGRGTLASRLWRWMRLLGLAVLFASLAVAVFLLESGWFVRGTEEQLVHVQVLAEDGFPAPDAILEVSAGEALRTHQGWLLRIPSGSPRTLRLTAHLPGKPYRAVRLLEVGDQLELSYDVILEVQKVGLRGIVVDSNDRPIAGATVAIEGLGSESVLSGVDGSFEIEDTHSDVGRPIRLRVSMDGYRIRTQSHPAGRRPVKLALELLDADSDP